MRQLASKETSVALVYRRPHAVPLALDTQCSEMTSTRRLAAWAVGSFEGRTSGWALPKPIVSSCSGLMCACWTNHVAQSVLLRPHQSNTTIVHSVQLHGSGQRSTEAARREPGVHFLERLALPGGWTPPPAPTLPST